MSSGGGGSSGGGTVLLGPGCLNFSLILNLESRPALQNIAESYQIILSALIQSLQLPNLTADLIQVRLERIQTDTAGLADCECSATGCDNAQGGRGPDFVVVSVNGGYSVTTSIPYIPAETILLRPVVRVPYGAL